MRGEVDLEELNLSIYLVLGDILGKKSREAMIMTFLRCVLESGMAVDLIFGSPLLLLYIQYTVVFNRSAK